MKPFLHVETSRSFAHYTDLIRSMGFRPVLLTRIRQHDPGYYEPGMLAAYDAVYDLDTLDSEAMLRQVRSLSMQPAAVLSCYDDMVIPAAELAQQLGLVHPSLEGLRSVHAKENTRRLLAAAGFLQPAFRTLAPGELTDAAPMDYPFVIKPSRDAGTDGVHICRNADDYSRARHAILAGENKTFSGADRGGHLVEAYVAGRLYVADLLWSGGRWVMLGIWRGFLHPGAPSLAGYAFPSELSAAARRSVEQHLFWWVDALGLAGGALAIEFKLAGGDPVLIEINPRHSGGGAYEILELAFGKPPIEHVFRYAAGWPDQPLQIVPQEGLHHAEAFLYPPRTGRVVAIDWPAGHDDHLIRCSVVNVPRDASRSGIFDDVLASVVATGRSCTDAMANAQRIVRQASVRYAD